MSQRASLVTIPQAPVPSMLSQPYPAFELSSSLRFIRMNMYWMTSLVFNISTVSLATFARQRTRDVKLRLVRQLRLRNAPKNDTAVEVPFDERPQSVFMALGMDTMYRLFQVALIIFLLGHIDAIVKPLGVIFLASVIVCGMLYVFRVIGLN